MLDLKKDFWIYDTEIEAPRLATFDEFDEMKAALVAAWQYRFLLRELDKHVPGDGRDYLKWVRAIRDALKKEGLI